MKTNKLLLTIIVLLLIISAVPVMASTTNAVGLDTAVNTSAFGNGDNASLLVSSGRLYLYDLDDEVGDAHLCRTNGSGDNPSTNGLRAVYQSGNGDAAAVAFKGTTLKVYYAVRPLSGIRQCGNLNAVQGGDDLNIGNINVPDGFQNLTNPVSVVVVQDEVTGRVIFRADSPTGKIIGRTNGAADNGTLLAGWVGPDGKAYALLGRTGSYRVITPQFNGGSVKLVNTVGRVNY